METEWYLIIVMALFVGVVCYVFTLYHQAHGRSLEAVRTGAEIVINALRDDGKIRDSTKAEIDDKPWTIDPFAETEEIEEESVLPDILTARSEQAANQMGSVALGKVTEALNGKV